MGNKLKRLTTLLFATAAVGLLVISVPTGAISVGAAPPTFDAHGSAEQVYVTGLADGDQVSLMDAANNTVATQSANPIGGVVFRNVPPGSGYRVKALPDGTESAPIEVHTEAAASWDPSIYDQPINDNGYQYLSTRDGTQLAIMVHPPLANAGQGPVPTLIEYSGYGYANPAGPQSGLALLANLMGFAVVDVNMRGTGCSGGSFDYFEPLQQLDGYDVIETIANQPWVLNNQVGMFGISYGGISQLFTAQLDPPSLAAISPLSVLDASATTLYPGGVLNTGFAVSWAQGRVDDAQPAGPETGQEWAYERIQDGDSTCAANQALHGDAVDLMAKVRDNAHYVPATADPLDPVTFVHKIKVPVFMACQWQDEQTGGHCPELVQHMTGTTRKWFTFANGAHIDSLDPATFNHLFDFLELYVAERAPIDDKATIRAVAPLIYQQAMGVPDTDKITLPEDPIQDEPTYASALAAFEQLPEVRVRFDNGAGVSPEGDTTPGNPYAGFEQSFSTLPVPGTQARTWYMGPDGALATQPSSPGGIDTYTSDASTLPLTNYTGKTGGGGLWGNASQWEWDWKQHPEDSAVSYLTAPLSQDTTVIGKGAVYAWVRSSTPDVDLQATITEVRPDGSETFVQNGWIRASERKLSTDSENLFKRPSTLLAPIPSFSVTDAAPMPANEFVEVPIPLYYQGHAYRVGSQIRVTISAPNGTQPVWAFGETAPSTGTAQIEIARTDSMPSSLVLPVVPGLQIPTDLPACPSLRNQPCRDYQPFTNRSVELPPTTTTTTSPQATTTTVPTTTTSPQATTTPSTHPSGTSGGDVGSSANPSQSSLEGVGLTGQLASTGARLFGSTVGAMVLVVLGSGLVVLARRRRLQN